MNSLATKYRPLLVAALALIALPFGLRLLGLSLNTGTLVVALAIAAMGLNLCVGYTGLVSFGHATWFGIGGYTAGLVQLHWLGGEIWLPLLLSMAVVAILSTLVGFVILRRRGVYFSLLTLALAALTYTIAFRWSAVTGGEDGLGGLKRGSIGAFSLDNAVAYYIIVALIALAVLYVLVRLVRSPFGHVLVAIRENQLRATFQGYPVERYKLGVFVISAVVTGLAGALVAFQTYLVSAEAVSVPFSGELLAMVVIGGMRSMLGPALGALFFILFRELFSIWTPNWLLWFGLIFVAFVLYSPGGLVGIWATLSRRWWPAPEEAAAMSKRRIYQGSAAAGVPDAGKLEGYGARGPGHLEEVWRHPRGLQRKPSHRRR
jgi:ABC-type branched-subunit amino acid transport system permease subunit